MISLNEYLNNLDLIEIKLQVPQVGFKKVSYETLSDIEPNEMLDFIINKEGELLIGCGHYKLNGKRNSLYFAGRLMIDNGSIIYIDNGSGHYIPTESELHKIASVLIKFGYASNNVKVVHMGMMEKVIEHLENALIEEFREEWKAVEQYGGAGPTAQEIVDSCAKNYPNTDIEWNDADDASKDWPTYYEVVIAELKTGEHIKIWRASNGDYNIWTKLDTDQIFFDDDIVRWKEK